MGEVGFGSRLCKNVCCYFCVARLWRRDDPVGTCFPGLWIFAGSCGPSAGWRRVSARCGRRMGAIDRRRDVAYAVLIAAISGSMPMMFMTRLRL